MLRAALYLVAVIASLGCTVLLFRSYLHTRVRLLLWSTICFVGLTLNNVLLFADLFLLPYRDLRIARLTASFAGLAFLLYGFVWDSER